MVGDDKDTHVVQRGKAGGGHASEPARGEKRTANGVTPPACLPERREEKNLSMKGYVPD